MPYARRVSRRRAAPVRRVRTSRRGVRAPVRVHRRAVVRRVRRSGTSRR